MKKLIKKKGFTLVELLVVIAIIGILAAVGVTALSGARTKARDAKRVADLKQMQSALELYFNDNASYPDSYAASEALPLVLGVTGTTCGGNSCLTISSAGIAGTAVAPTYMGMIPKDPSNPTGTCISTSAAMCNYSYISFDDADAVCTAAGGEVCSTYKIYAYLEGATAGLNAGVMCATQNGLGNTCP